MRRWRPFYWTIWNDDNGTRHSFELLNVTLELLSFSEASGEANGVSRSKLSKTFGLGLLTFERANGEDDSSTLCNR